jgi:hypothetical protein
MWIVATGAIPRYKGLVRHHALKWPVYPLVTACAKFLGGHSQSEFRARAVRIVAGETLASSDRTMLEFLVEFFDLVGMTLPALLAFGKRFCYRNFLFPVTDATISFCYRLVWPDPLPLRRMAAATVCVRLFAHFS